MTQKRIPASMFEVWVPGRSGEQDRRTLSFSRAPTVLLSHALNRLNQLSLVPLKNGPVPIGLVEFKLLVNLARYPGTTATSCAERLGIDKAAISRSFSKLEALSLTQHVSNASDERMKMWELTDAGYELHDYHIGGLLQFQIDLFDGLDPIQVEQFTATLEIMLQNMSNMNGENLGNQVIEPLLT